MKRGRVRSVELYDSSRSLSLSLVGDLSRILQVSVAERREAAFARQRAILYYETERRGMSAEWRKKSEKEMRAQPVDAVGRRVSDELVLSRPLSPSLSLSLSRHREREIYATPSLGRPGPGRVTDKIRRRSRINSSRSRAFSADGRRTASYTAVRTRETAAEREKMADGRRRVRTGTRLYSERARARERKREEDRQRGRGGKNR